jgi:hypothetical protein
MVQRAVFWLPINELGGIQLTGLGCGHGRAVAGWQALPGIDW